MILPRAELSGRRLLRCDRSDNKNFLPAQKCKFATIPLVQSGPRERWGIRLVLRVWRDGQRRHCWARGLGAAAREPGVQLSMRRAELRSPQSSKWHSYGTFAAMGESASIYLAS